MNMRVIKVYLILPRQIERENILCTSPARRGPAILFATAVSRYGSRFFPADLHENPG